MYLYVKSTIESPNYLGIFTITTKWYCRYQISTLFLPRFFIGYWILKAGLNFYSDPFFILYNCRTNSPDIFQLKITFVTKKIVPGNRDDLLTNPYNSTEQFINQQPGC